MTLTRRDMMAGSIALGAAAATPAGATPGPERVERWGVWDRAFAGPSGGNPFDDVTLAARFECAGTRVDVLGFYDGDGTWRIRFSPSQTGRWTWRTNSNVPALDGQAGGFEAIAPGPGNHGPVRVTADGYHFAYADGTPYRQIGTTAYSWAQQSDAKCAQTLATLKASPSTRCGCWSSRTLPRSRRTRSRAPATGCTTGTRSASTPPISAATRIASGG